MRSDLTDSSPEADQSVFKISPLIRLTLLSFYGALMLPLPLLAQVTEVNIGSSWLFLAIGLGTVPLVAVLSEWVKLDQQGIKVYYPAWIPGFFRSGWALTWKQIQALKPRSTSQGGLVYYLLSDSGQAYLLPMRVAGFTRLVKQIQAQTGIDTSAVRPLAQPWMYGILLGFTLLLFGFDGWMLWMLRLDTLA